MDYRHFVSHHKRSGAAITIAALPCDEKAATGFGLMKIDQEVGSIGLMSRAGKGGQLCRSHCRRALRREGRH